MNLRKILATSALGATAAVGRHCRRGHRRLQLRRDP